MVILAQTRPVSYFNRQCCVAKNIKFNKLLSFLCYYFLLKTYNMMKQMFLFSRLLY